MVQVLHSMHCTPSFFTLFVVSSGKNPKIKEVRAYTVKEDEGGADYHRQGEDHWIVGEISNPMSMYPKYKKNRTT